MKNHSHSQKLNITWTVRNNQQHCHSVNLMPLRQVDLDSGYQSANSAILTGDSNSGVVSPWLCLLSSGTPLPKSKSQIFTGVSCPALTQSRFSGFRSRWAIPLLCRKLRPLAISRTTLDASSSVRCPRWRIESNRVPPSHFSNTT